jgi:hypothetical protein
MALNANIVMVPNSDILISSSTNRDIRNANFNAVCKIELQIKKLACRFSIIG